MATPSGANRLREAGKPPRLARLCPVLAREHTPRSPPLASYLGPRLAPPRRDLRLITLRGPVHRDLRGVPEAVQQVRGAPQRISELEQPACQHGDPGQRPPLILTPPPHRRAAVQRGPQPGQLRLTQPTHRPARALDASAAATHTPNSTRPAAAAPPPAAQPPPRTTPRPATALPHALPAQRRTGHHH